MVYVMEGVGLSVGERLSLQCGSRLCCSILPKAFSETCPLNVCLGLFLGLVPGHA